MFEGRGRIKNESPLATQGEEFQKIKPVKGRVTFNRTGIELAAFQKRMSSYSNQNAGSESQEVRALSARR